MRRDSQKTASQSPSSVRGVSGIHVSHAFALMAWPSVSGRGDRNIPPDSCAHVTAAGRKQIVGGAGSNRDNCVARLVNVPSTLPPGERRGHRRGLTGVFVSLKHHLGISGDRVPELDAPILGATHHPVAVGSQADTEHKVLSNPSQQPSRRLRISSPKVATRDRRTL